MIGWAVQAWLASAVLIAFVLAVRVPVRRLFGARAAYGLWLLPALRFVLPPLPALWRQAALPAPIVDAGEKVSLLFTHPVHVTPAAASTVIAVAHPLPWGTIMLGVWLGGAATMLGWHIVRHHLFCRGVLSGASGEERLPGGVRLVRSRVAGPLAFGLARRYVAVPRDFAERYESDERDIAIAHELGHHVRGDLWANWAALTVLALHWPNPLAWLGFRAFRADQEMANDAALIARRGPKLRHAYARAIVKAAHGGAIPSACHLHTIDDIKGRLRMLATTTSRRRTAIGMVSVAALAFGGLGLTASGSRAATAISAGVHRATGIRLAALQVAPAPPSISTVSAVAVAPHVAMVGAQVTPATAPPPPMHAMPAMAGMQPMAPMPPMVPVDSRAIQAQVDAALADMPQVSSANCGPGDAKRMVVNDRAGGRNRIVICQDRIAAVAAQGAAAGMHVAEIERNAYREALAGLREARARVQADARLSAEERRDAMDSLDDSIGEMNDDIAHAGDDDD